MNAKLLVARIKRFIFVSPAFFLIFLIIPLLLLLGKTQPQLHGIPVSTGMMLWNILFLVLAVAQRFISALLRIRSSLRYDCGERVPADLTAVSARTGTVRDALLSAGYSFSSNGDYGEKRDLGFWGGIVFYAGFFALLSFGTWANLTQFSGTLLIGTGDPFPLAQESTYKMLINGPFASLKGLPYLKVHRQIFQSPEYPQGATEIALYTKEGKKLLRGIIEPYKPLHYLDYDINLSCFVYEVRPVIKSPTYGTILDDNFKLLPLAGKHDRYTHGNGFKTGPFTGSITYDPDKRQMHLIMARENKTILDTELVFQLEYRKQLGEFTVEFEKLGQWSEIHISRHRHMDRLQLFAIIAVIGALIRSIIRPRRVWLEDSEDGGCRVCLTGNGKQKLLKQLTLL